MAAGMRVTITGQRLADAMSVPEQAWQAAGNGLRLRIVQRTRARGVDANGATFHAYSESYKKAKAKRGGSVARVDLTGKTAGRRMLDDIRVRTHATTNPRIELSFATSDKNTIAQYHMGEGRVDREFFALSDDDLDYTIDYLKRALQARTG